MKEYKHIKLQVFKGNDNLPTCAKNFLTGEFCKFLGSRGFGTQSVCMVTGEDIHYEKFNENGIPTGFLRPLETCIIWNNNEENDE